MAERQLTTILSQLTATPPPSFQTAQPLLSRAKLLLLSLSALSPSSSTPTPLLVLARSIYEQGALSSIRAKDPAGFTRYMEQLVPFYELPANILPPTPSERSKVTGLYLLLLLTQGRYGEFHSELESLMGSGVDVEGDRYLGYPIRLERWLMEGSYDRVWKAMKQGEVPGEEFGVFSEILTIQIRNEIASSSERAYPSLPLSSTKSLLFLESEGAVVEFAKERGWVIRDATIYFPSTGVVQEAIDEIEQDKDTSKMIIENALGYARQLETIV